MAWIPFTVGADPADPRDLYLDPAEATAFCGALFQSGAATPGNASVMVASPFAVRSVPAGLDQLSFRLGPPGSDRPGPRRADGHHTAYGCVAQYVLDGYPAQPSAGRGGRRAVVHSAPECQHPNR